MLSLVLIISISLVSAGFFGGLWKDLKTITGEATDEVSGVDLKINGQDSPDPVIYNFSFGVSWDAGESIEYCQGSGTRIPLDNRDRVILWNNQNNLPAEGSKKLIVGAFLTPDPEDFDEMESIPGLHVKIKCFDNQGNAVSETINVPLEDQ